MMDRLNEKFSGYYKYFESFRKRLLVLSGFFLVSFFVGFFSAGKILRAIVSLFKLENATIVTTSPFQFLELASKIGLCVGILVCTPILMYQLYDFFSDGLNRKEKKLLFILLPSAAVLFVTGFFYSFTILYFYLNSVSNINLLFGMQNVWDISSFLSQIISASVFLGLIFQYPIVLTFLIRAGVLSVQSLIDKRWYAVACMFIFVGFLPPPDIFSIILQALPLVLIYQMTIWVNKVWSKKEIQVREVTMDTLHIAKSTT